MANSTRYLGWRFLMTSSERTRFSAMTFFAWAAIGVGVAAMICLLSIMYGFESTLKERVLKAFPHVIIRSQDASIPIRNHAEITPKLKALKGIARSFPFVEVEMIVQSSIRTLGAEVWGFPESEFKNFAVETFDGKFPTLKSKTPGAILGSELARRMGLEIGDEIQMISPTQRAGVGNLVPRSQRFEVTGLYTSGHYEFDQQYIFITMEDAQDLTGWKNSVSGWQIWAKRMSDSDNLQKLVTTQIPKNMVAQSWTEFNAALFQSLKLEQYAMFVILSFAVLIAVLNIVITLLMNVNQKKTQIGILRSLGASQKQVKAIFTWQGFFIGGIGIAAGLILSAVFLTYVKYFSTYQLPEIYYDRSIPIEIRPISLAVILLVAVVLVFLATWYPASRAAKLDPIEAIRE